MTNDTRAGNIHMNARRFVLFARANLEKEISIKDELVDAKVGPVYENGMEFSREVLVTGTVAIGCTPGELGNLIAGYLRKHTDLVMVRKVEFRDSEVKEECNEYRRAS